MFLVALSEYDQILVEENNQNRMEAQFINYFLSSWKIRRLSFFYCDWISDDLVLIATHFLPFYVNLPFISTNVENVFGVR